MSNNNFFLTMIVLTFTCISSRHLLFFSEATNLQRKVSLISQPTTTVSTPTPTQQSGNKTDKPKSLSSHLSMAAESGLTFISVFIFGCVIIASVYSWKKFSESSWGLPSTYQYSALSQYDNDRDEEINDLEDHLDILIEDSSSSDNEEEVPSKDILDIDAPATLPMHAISETTTTTAPETIDVKTKNGRLSNSSSLLDEDSEGDQELLTLQEKLEGRTNTTNS